MENKKMVTPGQIKYGRALEKRLGVPSLLDWERMTHKQARDRNALLLALSQCVAKEDDNILMVSDWGYMSWRRDYSDFGLDLI